MFTNYYYETKDTSGTYISSKTPEEAVAYLKHTRENLLIVYSEREDGSFATHYHQPGQVN